MYVVSELVYNPQPMKVGCDYAGGAYSFPPGSLTRFHFSNSPDEQAAALRFLDEKLGWALVILDADELAGGPNFQNQTGEENAAYGQAYLERIETEKRVSFVAHMEMEYVERIARDNQDPRRANKEPMQPSPFTRQMQNFIEAMKARLRVHDKYTPEIMAREATKAATEMGGLKYSDLNFPELKKMAADRKLDKLVVKGGRETILAALRAMDDKKIEESAGEGDAMAGLIAPVSPPPTT